VSKTTIKSYKASPQGVAFELTVKASLKGGGLKAKSWFVSWDKIGESLLGEQYYSSSEVKDLDDERNKYK
jgi:hypothetical protein